MEKKNKTKQVTVAEIKEANVAAKAAMTAKAPVKVEPKVIEVATPSKPTPKRKRPSNKSKKALPPANSVVKLTWFDRFINWLNKK